MISVSQNYIIREKLPRTVAARIKDYSNPPDAHRAGLPVIGWYEGDDRERVANGSRTGLALTDARS
jgi:hypothetical protein